VKTDVFLELPTQIFCDQDLLKRYHDGLPGGGRMAIERQTMDTARQKIVG
jgi:hypothetical protein